MLHHRGNSRPDRGDDGPARTDAALPRCIIGARRTAADPGGALPVAGPGTVTVELSRVIGHR